MEGYVLVLVFMATLAGVQAGYNKNSTKRVNDYGGRATGYGDDMTKKGLDNFGARMKRNSLADVQKAAEAAAANLLGAAPNVQSWSVLILVSLLMVYLANSVYM